VNNRIGKINLILDSKLDPLKRLSLLQERIDLTQELKTIEDNSTDLVAELQPDFIIAAKSYGERKGISYAAWREFGVPAAVLKAAGISRVAAA
jgi:ABC-type phosphate transport system auxiliary subunit